MTSVSMCIRGKVAAGIIDKNWGESVLKDIDKIDARLAKYPEAKAKEAYAQLGAALGAWQKQKRIQLLKEIEAKDRIFKTAKANPGGFENGLMATLSHSLDGRADGLNVDKLRSSIRSLTYADMPDLAKEVTAAYFGLSKNRKSGHNIVRALFGDTADEKSSVFAEQWRKAERNLRERFIKAGGRIDDNERWLLPQSHDSRLLNETTQEDWVDFILPKLDLNRMIDNKTGAPFKEDELREVLADVYETLRTNGMNKKVAGKAEASPLSEKYNNSRFLYFKDADGWIAYNERFGNNDPFKTMIDYVEEMANDIAFMEIWGPNPTKLKDYMVDVAKIESGKLKDRKAKSKAASKIDFFENLWADVSGESSVAVNPRIAEANQGLRAWLIADQLGSCFLSQMSDLVTNGMTARFNGLSTSGIYKNLFDMMVSNQKRDFAAHIGLGFDEVTKTIGSAQRYAGEKLNSGWAQKISGAVMKASLLERMTTASKKAFSLDFVNTLANNADTQFASLNKGLKSCFERYGLTNNDWDIIRKSKLDNFKGAKYVNISELAKSNVEVANKLQNMILTEQDFAVIDSNPRTRALLIGNSKPGTLSGEARRWFGLYKTFPITMMTHHISRVMSMPSAASKLGYVSAMFSLMTMAGYLSMQAKFLISGKKPADPEKWETWLAAATQGGGAGILGDFLFSDANRFGGSLGATLAGPGMGLIEDIYKISIGNIQELIADKETKFGAEFSNLVRRYTPGNNLWYTRLAVERALFDNLTRLLDDDAEEKFRRLRNKQEKEYGAGFWWEPGNFNLVD